MAHLHNLAAQLGYALRHGARNLPQDLQQRFLVPIAAILKDVQNSRLETEGQSPTTPISTADGLAAPSTLPCPSSSDAKLTDDSLAASSEALRQYGDYLVAQFKEAHMAQFKEAHKALYDGLTSRFERERGALDRQIILLEKLNQEYRDELDAGMRLERSSVHVACQAPCVATHPPPKFRFRWARAKAARIRMWFAIDELLYRKNKGQIDDNKVLRPQYSAQLWRDRPFLASFGAVGRLQFGQDLCPLCIAPLEIDGSCVCGYATNTSASLLEHFRSPSYGGDGYLLR